MTPLQRRHLILIHSEHLSGGGGVDILAGAESLLHGLVVGNMGQHPQLDLAVIRIHQHTAGLGDEHLADLSPKIGAHGNVLQIRLGGRQPPGGGDQVLERGVDPAVLPDLLHQSVGIGGFQLGQHAVIHNGGDDGVLVLQLLQHVGIGGIAGFGFLHRGQPQLVEQYLAQLLGGIDIEGCAGIGINQRLAVGDMAGQHFPEGGKLLPVDGNAPALHFIEHPAQGQLDLLVKLLHAAPVQLLGKGLVQQPHGLSTGRRIPILHRHSQEGGGQLGHGIIGLGGIQVIGGKSCIERHFPAVQPQLRQAVQGAFGIVEDQLCLRGQAQRVHLGLHGRQRAYAALPGNAQAAVRGKIQCAGIQVIRHRLRLGQMLRFGDLGGLYRGAAQAVLIDQLDKFQPLEQLIQLLLVVGLEQRVLRRKVDGRFRDDGGELIGKVCVVLARLQLLPKLGADGGIVQIGIHTIQAAEFQQQLLGCFRADSCHAGDIVRSVAHQGLQVDQLLRLEAVLRLKLRSVIQGGVGLAGLGDHQLYIYVIVNELQTVPVAGDDDALPGIVGADASHGADHVVRLPALALIDGNAHGPEHLLHDGHLLGQLLGHPMAGGLVAIVAQVAEGGTVKVKGNGDGIRLLLLLHPLQDVQEPEDGMGIQPIPGGQGLDAEIGAVDDAVAIQNQKLHTFLHLAPWGVSMISMPRAFSSSRMRSASA